MESLFDTLNQRGFITQLSDENIKDILDKLDFCNVTM
jgi:hypothetical protein